MNGSLAGSPSEAETARYLCERFLDSLRTALALNHIKPVHNEIREVSLGTFDSFGKEGTNACAVHIQFRRLRSRAADDMRPSSLWVVCSFDDRILVLASGANAWTFRRVEESLALKRAEDVLAQY